MKEAEKLQKIRVKNISKKQINVNGRPINFDEEFSVENTQEIENLITHKYLEVVKVK